MSRVGKVPVALPSGVTVNWKSGHLVVNGPKGKLERTFYPGMELEIHDKEIVVTKPGSRDRLYRGLYGTTRSLIANMVKGVTEGFEKRLEIQGVGYRAQVEKNKMTLFVGFSHPVEFHAPEGIVLETPKPTQITVKGIDKERVGAVAAEIRFVRPPEPYKGKGIRYEGEPVRIKVGKAAASGGGAGGEKKK